MKQDVKGIGMTSERTRARLIQRLREKGIHDERVLAAMQQVPRHLLIDEALASHAYEDTPLPIGHGQTISQPYIVARMTQALFAAGPLRKVLEVGTGSGYQTAVLAALAPHIFTVERIEPLWKLARRRLPDLGVTSVQFKLSDGGWGWPEHALYDGILVTAAAEELPPSLIEQLVIGGRLVVPVGQQSQQLLLIVRTPDGYTTERLEDVYFVPLVRDRRE